MAHTTRRSRRPALWGETAGTVGVIADPAAFALMRRYPTFAFRDHAGYLRRTEGHLRAVAGRHGHTSVALFDPAGFADYCAREGLEPDSPASRARYTADVAARGATVPYRGQPMSRLLPELLAEHLRWETWEAAGEVLAAAGTCPRCAAPQARCAFARAAAALAAVLAGLAPGTHRLVCSVSLAAGPLTAALSCVTGGDGALRVAEPEALVLCTVLGAGLATGEPGGLVLRARPGAGAAEEVCGWSLREGRLRPLTEGEVFTAYCTDAHTGEPVPPEPGVAYRAAPPLPPPRCPEG
jgi:hypothetical protein